MFHVMRLPALSEAVPTGMPYMPLLDNWVSVTGVNAAGYTTWTMPHSDASADCVVLGAGFAVPGTVLISGEGGLARLSATEFRIADADGTYAAHPVYIGTRFNGSMQLSRPYSRDSSGAAILDADTMLHYIVLTHHNTGDYTVTTSMPDVSDSTETFVPDNSQMIDATGETQFFVRGLADETTVTVAGLSPKPWTIVCGEFIATLQPRATL